MPDMTFPSGCWSHFYDLNIDTPVKVNKSLKEVVSLRRANAMVDIVLMDSAKDWLDNFGGCEKTHRRRGKQRKAARTLVAPRSRLPAVNHDRERIAAAGQQSRQKHGEANTSWFAAVIADVRRQRRAIWP
jgi:hypothetical protein